MQEEGQPQVPGCLTGDIDAVEAVRVERFKPETLGRGVTRGRIGERDAGLERLAVREEQAAVRLLLTEVDPSLQMIQRSVETIISIAMTGGKASDGRSLHLQLHDVLRTRSRWPHVDIG